MNCECTAPIRHQGRPACRRLPPGTRAHAVDIDVPGDRPIDIASGPTVADPTTCADALAILRRHGIEMPAAVRDVLESGLGESIKPGDLRLARSEVCMIAAPQMALEAAA